MLKVATLPSHYFAVFYYWIRTSESAWATSAAVLLSCNLGVAWRWVPFIRSSWVRALSFFQCWRIHARQLLKFYGTQRWFQISITTHKW